MISRALKTIRIYHNIKQAELATDLNISKSYLSEIESGKKNISFDMLEKYSDLFDIPVSSLVFLSERENKKLDNNMSERFRYAFAEKVLKILEWSNERAEEKKIKNKDNE